MADIAKWRLKDGRWLQWTAEHDINAVVAGEPLVRGGMWAQFWVTKGRCCQCLKDTVDRCRAENPKWFTPKKGLVATKFTLQVRNYLRDKTPLRVGLASECVINVFDMDTYFDNDDFWNGTDVRLICKEHLLELLPLLDTPEGSSYIGGVEGNGESGPPMSDGQ